MNKNELVRATSERTGITIKDTEATLNGIIETIQTTVAAGDKVQLIGFGTFEPRERSAREANNPANGEKIMIPAKTVPAFKAGQLFKNAVNDKSPLKPTAKSKKK